MKAKFVGDENNPGEAKSLPETFTAFGIEFEKGKFVEIPADLEAKFEDNSHFETQGKSAD